MNNNSHNSAVTDDLEGLLRDAVEQVRSSEVPQDRMQQCLDRVMNLAPRQTVVDQGDGHAARGVLTSFRRLGIALTATALTVTAIVVLQYGLTSTSLADVARAVRQQPWIHVTRHDPDGDSEVWYSPASDISATRRKNWIAYHDHKLKVYYSYDVEEAVLYRVPEIGTPQRQSRVADISETLSLLLAEGVPPEDPLAKLKFLNSQQQELKLVQQSVENVKEGGRDWLDYKLSVRKGDSDQIIEILFRVDPVTKLPHLQRVTGQHDGQAISTEATFDYPESGPRDIYAIGVPSDAKLIDRIPTDDVSRLIAGVEVGRSRFDDFRAIVVTHTKGSESWWRERPDIIHRKGNRIRRDLSYYFSAEAVKPEADAEVSQWWKKRAREFRYAPTRICIGGTDHSIKSRSVTESDGSQRRVIESTQKRESALNAEQWIPAFWSLTPDYVARPPLGIPSQQHEAVVETDPAEGPEGTVLLRVRRTGRVDAAPDPDADKRPPQPDEYRFWIDPSREYLVMRMDMMGSDGQAASSYIVESIAQSPQGHWYPTQVRRTSSLPDIKDQIINFYVEFDVNLPDSLFDVKKPQLVEELLQRSSPSSE